MDKTLEELKQKTSYEGCQNCADQIEPLRSCEWLENGGDGTVNLICPRWKQKTKRSEK